MRHVLKLIPVITAIALSACGGGFVETGPVTPLPPVQEPAPAVLIAGLTAPTPYDPLDKETGCVDGAALGAKLGPGGRQGTFARSTNGDLLLAAWGRCDDRPRIRLINPDTNTIKTLTVGTLGQIDDKGALTTFFMPTSLAVAPSGDIYIGDSEIFTVSPTGSLRYSYLPGRGPGIWKLGVDGNISVLAGVSRPMSGGLNVDGAGAAAAFQYIATMCYGADNLLYVNDNFTLRTVSLDGAVTTVTNPDYRLAVVACGIDGSVLVLRSWFNNPANDDFYDPIAQKSIAKVSASALRVMINYNPILYFGPSNPSVLIQEGGPSYSGLAIVSLIDGSSTTVAKFSTPGTPVDLAATPPVIDQVRAAVAIGGTDFDILTNQGVIRFTRKP